MDLHAPGQVEIAKSNIRSILALLIEQQEKLLSILKQSEQTTEQNEQNNHNILLLLKEHMDRFYRQALDQTIQRLCDHLVLTRDHGTSMSLTMIIRKKVEEASVSSLSVGETTEKEKETHVVLPIDLIHVENQHLRVIAVSIDTHKRCISHFENHMKPMKLINEESYHVLLSKFADKYREMEIDCLLFHRENVPQRDKLHNYNVLRSLEHRIELSHLFLGLVEQYMREFASVYPVTTTTTKNGNVRVKQSIIRLAAGMYMNIGLRAMEQSAKYRVPTFDEKLDFLERVKGKLSEYCQLLNVEPFEYLDTVIFRLFFYGLLDLRIQGMQYFEHMKKHRNGKLSVQTYNVMLSEMPIEESGGGQCGDNVFAALEEMRQHGVEPNVSSYATLIRKLGEKHLDLVQKLVAIIKKTDGTIIHNSKISNALLAVYARWQDIESMDTVIASMLETAPKSLALIPDRTMHLVLNAYLAKDHLMKADRFGQSVLNNGGKMHMNLCRQLVTEAMRKNNGKVKVFWDNQLKMLLSADGPIPPPNPARTKHNYHHNPTTTAQQPTASKNPEKAMKQYARYAKYAQQGKKF